MKATGIVRRIDGLGRVVIPKEIRRTFRIHESDPLEIFVEGDCVIFRKYSPFITREEAVTEYAHTLYENCALPICVTDTDKVISSFGAKVYLETANTSAEQAKSSGEYAVEIRDDATVVGWLIILKEGRNITDTSQLVTSEIKRLAQFTAKLIEKEIS